VIYAAEHAGNAFLPRELNLFWGEKLSGDDPPKPHCSPLGARRDPTALGAQ
jgi:hypothetical protein